MKDPMRPADDDAPFSESMLEWLEEGDRMGDAKSGVHPRPSERYQTTEAASNRRIKFLVGGALVLTGAFVLVLRFVGSGHKPAGEEVAQAPTPASPYAPVAAPAPEPAPAPEGTLAPGATPAAAVAEAPPPVAAAEAPAVAPAAAAAPAEAEPLAAEAEPLAAAPAPAPLAAAAAPAPVAAAPTPPPVAPAPAVVPAPAPVAAAPAATTPIAAPASLAAALTASAPRPVARPAAAPAPALAAAPVDPLAAALSASVPRPVAAPKAAAVKEPVAAAPLAKVQVVAAPPTKVAPGVAPAPVANGAPLQPLTKASAKIAAPGVMTTPAPSSAALSPAYTAALTQCRAYMTAGKIRHAVDSCRQANAAEPRAPEALTLLAEAEFTRGHTGVALKLATEATNAAPGYADAYVIIGGVYQDKGKPAEARAAYEQYLALQPKGKHAADLRAILAGMP
jgi:hypothetical protein